jgi:hypothetical protein
LNVPNASASGHLIRSRVSHAARASTVDTRRVSGGAVNTVGVPCTSQIWPTRLLIDNAAKFTRMLSFQPSLLLTPPFGLDGMPWMMNSTALRLASPCGLSTGTSKVISPLPAL